MNLRSTVFAFLGAYCASAGASASPAPPSGKDPLPDRPGAALVIRESPSPRDRAARALAPFAVEIRGGGRLAPGAAPEASFTVSHDPGSVLGRIDLVRLDPVAADSVTSPAWRVYLHGQGTECTPIAPGRYRMQAAFWAVDLPLLVAYPHTTDFELRAGQAGRLTLDRESLRTIRKWLKADEKTPNMKR